MLLFGVLRIATGLFQQRPDLARRGGQLRFVLGQQPLGLFMPGRGRGDVVGDLPLAFVQGRGNLRPGKLAQKPRTTARTRPTSKSPDRDRTPADSDRRALTAFRRLGLMAGFFSRLLAVCVDALRSARSALQRAAANSATTANHATLTMKIA